MHVEPRLRVRAAGLPAALGDRRAAGRARAPRSACSSRSTSGRAACGWRSRAWSREAAALVSAQVELSEVEAQGERLARAELRALRAQISPHFIYNALAAVAAFIHSRPEEARELLIEFAEFIRYAFARERPYVTLADELQYVEKYLRLEQARFGERLRVRVQVDPEILHAVVPVLSLQPLVENAVRHGVESRPEGGLVTIEGRDLGADVELRVSDDGAGIDPERAAAALAGARTGYRARQRARPARRAPSARATASSVENGERDDRGDDRCRSSARGCAPDERRASRCSPSTTSARRSRTSCACCAPRRRSRRVEAAASAAEALVALGETAEPFDALFLDVRMPGLDGLELARVLRRFERPPAIVFVSAYDDAAVDAFELAALDYLVKPVSRQRLDEAIDRVRRAARAAPLGAEGARRRRAAGRHAARRRHAAARALARSSTCRRTATTCASRPTRAASCCARGWPTSRRAGRATGSCACTAATSSTCAARSRSARSSTAPPCSSWPTAREVPIARRQVGELRRRLAV